MKPHRLARTIRSVILAGLVPIGVCGAQEVREPAIFIESSEGITDLPPELEAIVQAPSPSAAIQAYNRARAVESDNPALDEILMLRMLELGAPEMCAAQAQRIVDYHPDNGLAWAVLAFNAARVGDYPTALAQIVEAVRGEPRDPFVQRTAGQLLAWYDTQGRSVWLPAELREGLRHVRRELSGQREYHAAYRQAREFYARVAGAGYAGDEAPSAAAEPIVTPVTTIPWYVDFDYRCCSYPLYRRIYVDRTTCRYRPLFPTRTAVVVRHGSYHHDRRCEPARWSNGWPHRPDRDRISHDRRDRDHCDRTAPDHWRRPARSGDRHMCRPGDSRQGVSLRGSGLRTERSPQLGLRDPRPDPQVDPARSGPLVKPNVIPAVKPPGGPAVKPDVMPATKETPRGGHGASRPPSAQGHNPPSGRGGK